MIRLGSTEVTTLPGIAKVLLGDVLVWPMAVGSDDLIVPTYSGVYPTYSDVARGFAWLVPSGYTRLTGIVFDGDTWYDTGMVLHGSDTLRLSFKATKACNVMGSYSTADAQNNYSLYVTTTSGGKYLRYNGGTYNSYIATNTQYTVVITPTGSSGMRTDSTWSQATFTTPNNFLIGTTSVGATSAKFTGTMYGDIEVDGRAYIVPHEKDSDNSIVYIDVMSGTVLTNQGSGTPTKLAYY